MLPTFPNLPGLLSKYLISKFSPRSAHSPERDEFLPDLSVKSDDIQPWLHKVFLALRMVLQIVVHMAFFPSAKRSWTFRR